MKFIFCPLNDWGVLQVSGQQAGTFLQGQLTCDVNRLTDHTTCLGAYCNRKGRVMAAFRLFQYGEAYYLSLPRSILAETQTLFKRYATFSNVTVQDVSASWQIIGCTGNNITEQLAAHYSIIPPQEINDCILAKVQKSNKITQSARPSEAKKEKPLIKNDTLIIRTTSPFSQPTLACFELLVSLISPRDTQQTTIEAMATLPPQSCKPATSTPVSSDFWHWITMQSSMAYIYPETAGRFTPHKLNYQQHPVVSFTKGCYLGQEVIARSQYLGKNKYGLYWGRWQNPVMPARYSSVVNSDNQVIGYVVDVAPDYTQTDNSNPVLVDGQFAVLMTLLHSAFPLDTNPYLVPEGMTRPDYTQESKAAITANRCYDVVRLDNVDTRQK